jgi:hypothetical protein
MTVRQEKKGGSLQNVFSFFLPRHKPNYFMQEDQMKFFLLTIGVLLFIPAFAAAQFSYQINSFDALPDTGAGYTYYDDGGANTHLIRTIDTDNKYEGTGALRMDWQDQCYDQYGGWIGMNYFDPDSGFLEDFGLYDSVSGSIMSRHSLQRIKLNCVSSFTIMVPEPPGVNGKSGFPITWYSMTALAGRK